MQFRVLGEIEVVDAGQPVALGGRKPRTLLVHLLLAAGRPVSREQLIDELWGDAPPPTARDSLNVHIAALRRVLGTRLHTVGGGYLLEIAPDEVDAFRFEALVTKARGQLHDPAAAAETLVQALALWRGPTYGGMPVGPTAEAAAARLEELRLNALEDRFEADLALGRHAELVGEITGTVASNPGRERLAGQLMLALHRSGRSADALSVYEATCAALDAKLGVDPGNALMALSRAVHRDDPALAAPGPTSLPAATSSFVGRRQELAAAGDLLASSRLLTLSGPGGGGKTRLALELARASAAAHPGGVAFVDLAPLASSGLMVRQIAAVLGARERRGTPLSTVLAAHLRHHRTLLVLDSCERRIGECAELVTLLLEAAAGLRVLTTSREPLGVPGEVVFTVPGMQIPDAGASAEELASSDAIRLLTDRAAAARPGFRLEADEITVAATLCRRLDGLPLAIELAASRLRGLSIGEVAVRLTERLDEIGSSRAVHARHRTMRAAIEWSHDVLPEHESVALRRLSVFAGDLRPDAAAGVAGGWEPLHAGADVPEICSRLADKSMLVAKHDAQGTRYRLLDTVRQYAMERLAAAGEETRARERHAAWFHDLVPDPRQWAGPEQSLWMDRLRPDVDNLRGALGWYLGDGWQPQRAVEMAGPMWWFWYMDGLIGEGRVWLRRVLAATPVDPDPARGLALRGAAALARIMQDLPEAIQLGEESLAVFRELGDRRGVAAALNNLCISAMWKGDLDAAQRYGEESLEVVEPLDDSQGLANARNNLGLVARNAGELDRAEELFAAARDGYRTGGNGRGLAAALTNLAIISCRRVDTEGGTALALEALRLYTDLRFEEGQIDCLEVLAALEVGAGIGERALRLMTVCGRARVDLGAPLGAADEQRQRIDAEAGARRLLGEQAAHRVVAAAERASLDEVVTEVLEQHRRVARDTGALNP